MTPLRNINELLVSKAPYKQPAIVGLTLIMLIAFGLTALSARGSGPADLSHDIEAPENPAVAANSEARRQARCPECGVIVSLREIEPAGKSVNGDATGALIENNKSKLGEKSVILARYEITVRMRGGTNRTFVDTNPANWRPGERVSFIEGARQASN